MYNNSGYVNPHLINRQKGERQTNQEEKDKNEYKIVINEPLDFEGTTKGEIVTTITVCKRINEVIHNVFNDYEGCVIQPNHYTGEIDLTLYFRDKGRMSTNQEGKYNAIEPIAQQKQTGDVFDRIQSMNVKYNSKQQYTLSKPAKQMLSEFIKLPQGQKVNWNQYVFEKNDNLTNQFYQGPITVEVRGLNLLSMIRKIYGADVEGAKYDYSITPIKPIGAIQGVVENYLLLLTQLNNSKLRDISQEIGMIPCTGSIPMIR